MKTSTTTTFSLIVAATLSALASASFGSENRGVTVADADLRSAPNLQARHLTMIPAGTVVRIHGCIRDRGWCRVTYNRARGWITGRSLSVRQSTTEQDPAPVGSIPILESDMYWPAENRDLLGGDLPG